MMTLNDFRKIYKLRKTIDELCEKRKTIYNTVHSPNLFAPKMSRGRGAADPTAEAVYKLHAMDERIADHICELCDQIEEALDWMKEEQTPPDVCSILIARFLSGKSWEDVGRSHEGATYNALKKRLYRYFDAV